MCMLTRRVQLVSTTLLWRKDNSLATHYEHIKHMHAHYVGNSVWASNCPLHHSSLCTHIHTLHELVEWRV